MKGYLLSALVLSFFLTACQPSAKSDPKTELAPLGNERVARLFEEYKQNRLREPRCQFTSDGAKRILVTGFAPFTSGEINISGAVAEAIGTSRFLPSDVTTTTVSSAPATLPAIGGVPVGNTAQVRQRTLKIDGTLYHVCSIVAVVQWDLASAVFVNEAQNFKPHLIIMSGRGGSPNMARLEFGAVNDATAMAGFNRTGDDLGEANFPRDTYVLPAAEGVRSEIHFNWDAQRMSTSARPAMSAMNSDLRPREPFGIDVVRSVDRGNNYICNNVSFVMMHGIAGVPLQLAGGRVKISPEALGETKAGFLHYPYEAGTTPQDLWYWAHAVLAMMKI